MAQITDFFIDQGSDWSAILTFNNTDGTPRDFTGCTVSGQMRKGYGSTTYTAITTTFIAPNSSGKIKLELGNIDKPIHTYIWSLKNKNSLKYKNYSNRLQRSRTQ